MLTYVKRTILALLIVAFESQLAFAWPDKPIRLFIGFQAGGGSDNVGRLIAEELRQHLGTRVVIDNRPGESGLLAIEAVRQATDDHTLLLFTHEFITLPLVNKNAKFETTRDFRAISLVAEGPYVFVSGSKAPFKSFNEFVAYSRANPGKLRYATSGVGTQLHLIGEYVTRKLGLALTHLPTRGGGGAANDLLDGKVNLAVLGATPIMHGVHDGKLHPLAVTTSARVPQFPNTPTLAEVGITDFVIFQRYGLVAPRNMPDAVVNRIAKVVSAAVMEEEFREKLAEFGLRPRVSTPADYQFELQDGERRWARMVKEYDLKVD